MSMDNDAEPYNTLLPTGDGYSIKHPDREKRQSLIRAQMAANKVRSSEKTHNREVHDTLLPTGDGYSIKHPEGEKRQSLIRAQIEANKVLSPKEARRREARKKYLQSLGGDNLENHIYIKEEKINKLNEKAFGEKEEGENEDKSSSASSAAKERFEKLSIDSLHTNQESTMENKNQSHERIHRSQRDSDTNGQEPTNNGNIFDHENVEMLSEPKTESFLFAKSQAEVALRFCITYIPYRERVTLLLDTVTKIIYNAKRDPTKRRLKLSNKLLWERVCMHYGGRGLLNAVGFILDDASLKNESAPGREAFGAKWSHQPVDEMEDLLKKLGRDHCAFRLVGNPCFDMMDGVLEAIESCRGSIRF